VILGVAQVVVNVESLPDAERVLQSAGYVRSFAEDALPNHPAKAPFQATVRDRLALAHFAAPGAAPAIELTQYAGAPPRGEAAFRLVASAALPGIADEVGSDPPSVPVAVRVPGRSDAFWQAIGFVDDGFALSFPALMPSWRLRLERDTGRERSNATVDARGCVLVTMLSTDVAGDLRRLENLVLRSSAAWAETVGGRPLRAALVEGPAGELVELLELGMRTQGGR